MFKDKIKLKKWKKWNEENRKFSRNVFIAGCMFFIISYIGMGFFIGSTIWIMFYDYISYS